MLNSSGGTVTVTVRVVVPVKSRLPKGYSSGAFSPRQAGAQGEEGAEGSHGVLIEATAPVARWYRAKWQDLSSSRPGRDRCRRGAAVVRGVNQAGQAPQGGAERGTPSTCAVWPRQKVEYVLGGPHPGEPECRGARPQRSGVAVGRPDSLSRPQRLPSPDDRGGARTKRRIVARGHHGRGQWRSAHSRFRSR